MRPVTRTILACQFAILGLGGANAAGASAQEGTPVATPETPSVEVQLRDANNVQVGSARLSEGPGGAVTVTVSVEGLTPDAHGIHVHETGICDATGDEPFASAGAHFNPTGVDHGAPPEISGDLATPVSGGARNVQAFDTTPTAGGTPDVLATAVIVGTPAAGGGHAGDLGNIVGANEGPATYSIVTDRFTLAEGPNSLRDADGSALIIHADRDDLVTDPGGSSGGRVVCGVIYPPAGGAQAEGTPTT